MADEEDPYALSSSDSEDERKPPPKIQIEGRENAGLEQLKSALMENKEIVADDSRKEELEQLKQAKDTKKMKEDFEAGSVSNTSEDAKEAKAAQEEERQKLTEISKEKYSKFKDRFEHLDTTLDENLEEKLKRMEKEMVGLGKETLASAKEKFEKGEGDVVVERSQIDLERSVDLGTRKAAFNRDPTADEVPKDCALCGKVVYPVERIFANKQLYHSQCFKCCKCDKKLTPNNFNTHEGKLLCKVHLLEIFHPEIAKTMDPVNTEEDERDADDDEEFATSSKPKQRQGVVKSGAVAVQEELAQIKSLKDKKGDFESSVKEAANVEKKTKIDDDLVGIGRVKANAERFVSGAALADDEQLEDDTVERDPNVIREDKKKKKEELDLGGQVGDIKGKWMRGEVETAEQKAGEDKKDLEELKGGLSVKERFHEKSGDAAEEVVERQWNKNELDTSAAAEARKSFVQGGAYQGANVEKSATDLADLKFGQLKNFKERFEKGEGDAEVQKTAVDMEGVELGNLKAAFEKGEAEMTAEERAALKKKEIEAEFLRYKLARRAAAERTKQQEETGGESVVLAGDGGEAVGSIKDRFDTGNAFKSQQTEGRELDVEFKMAGKAREKFRQIDASGAQPVMPGQKKAEPSKWDKKEENKPVDVINRRQDDREDTPEDEDAFDVKNLMNKFKNIGESSSTSKATSESRAELDSIRFESKNLKKKFEEAGGDDAEILEEKKKIMQEEFEMLKKEREEAQKKLEEERMEEGDSKLSAKEDIEIKADHASKMAAKWEKIQAKEAKKAEKGRMPEKKTTRILTFNCPSCAVCSKSVYVAEQFQCFGLLYHVKCFRCCDCKQALRVEKVHRDRDGAIYCAVHFKKLNEKKEAKEELERPMEESRSQA